MASAARLMVLLPSWSTAQKPISSLSPSPNVESSFPSRVCFMSAATPHVSRCFYKARREIFGRRESLIGTSNIPVAPCRSGSSVLSSSDANLLGDLERICLPIDPGVVLLDFAFVPDQPDHGFLLGTKQTLLETKDGGRTWKARSVSLSDEEDFSFKFNSISFLGQEGWIIGKPSILLHTTNAGETWDRISPSSKLLGNPVVMKATGENSAEMVTDEVVKYMTSNKGFNWRAAADIPTQAESVTGATTETVQAEFKSLPDLDYLQELLAIQQQGPRAIGFFGTRNMGFMHQQLIEILSYAMVITKNHIYTSGASGTNAAVIRGALRAEKPELLTVILPQSLRMQPPESQELLSKVQNVVEMPHNDNLQLIEASRLCNMDILSHVQQVICFAFHDSNLLMETCQEAKNLRKIVTLFYLD